MTSRPTQLAFALALALSATAAQAEPPSTHYIFPAGAQRGAQVNVRVGGCYLFEQAPLVWLGPPAGITAGSHLAQTERVWFEGPVIRQPASQQKEDYPLDYAARIAAAKDAPLGLALWRTWTAQGATPPLPFVIGDLPEVVEDEYDGEPLPSLVALPVTVNGRIFPREDVDVWAFELAAGQSVACQVAAAEIGSPLEAQLEVRDASGRLLAEGAGQLGRDPRLRFTAPGAGRYEVRIRDSAFRGLQPFVYRLTLTTGPVVERVFPLGGRRGAAISLEAFGQALPAGELPVTVPNRDRGAALSFFAGSPTGVLFDVDDLPEVREPAASELSPPVIANGRIAQPGEVDAWPFVAKKGEALLLEVRAARLGSPLDAALVIKDAIGKELAKADDLPGGSPDCELAFSPPADGVYTAELRERFRSRGGPAFAYRLRIAPAAADFALTLAAGELAVDAGSEKKLAVNIARLGGHKAPIKLTVSGLPAGVSVAEATAAPNQNKVELVFKATAEAPVTLAGVTISGEAEEAGAQLVRKATFTPPFFGAAPVEQLALVVSLATPFRFKGQYEFKYVPRGGGLKKSFAIERNGFSGPLFARLADRQGRHLQGVSGPTVAIPPGADSFEFAVDLPPWMELGRTSRSNLMLFGELADATGKKYKVSFSTNEQNDQLIALVSPAPLRLSTEKSVLPAVLGSELVVPVQIHRDRALDAAVELSWKIPTHIRGVTAPAHTVPAGQAQAALKLVLDKSAGPFNAPLLLKAVARRGEETITAELPVELVLEAAR